jgi:hypothetical protein
VKLFQIKSKTLRKNIASLIRNINMGLKSKGFADNKGLTDKAIESLHGFFWYFDDKKTKDEAERQINELIKSAHAKRIGIQSTIRKTRIKGSFCKRILLPSASKNNVVIFPPASTRDMEPCH